MARVWLRPVTPHAYVYLTPQPTQANSNLNSQLIQHFSQMRSHTFTFINSKKTRNLNPTEMIYLLVYDLQDLKSFPTYNDTEPGLLMSQGSTKRHFNRDI